MYNDSKSDNKGTKINEKADEVIEKLFKLLLTRYQNNLETSMGASNFIFGCAHVSKHNSVMKKKS